MNDDVYTFLHPEKSELWRSIGDIVFREIFQPTPSSHCLNLTPSVSGECGEWRVRASGAACEISIYLRISLAPTFKASFQVDIVGPDFASTTCLWWLVAGGDHDDDIIMMMYTHCIFSSIHRVVVVVVVVRAASCVLCCVRCGHVCVCVRVFTGGCD